ncbi:MAG: peptide chain release factor 2 [Deltaproteobacteria bacterium GWA2_38_16]|nr:MAG: peptide chain release factor 2 [Deltaproteobacteria bacterium GWA2_38_16]OGQ03825.1 MAG: peptide chain release factor 2 [Deltaproteobacteria bacterium RIFCSPHIGHO2_02_FULL_38_15]
MSDSQIWSNQSKAQALLQEKKRLEDVISQWESLSSELSDIETLLELAEEAKDEASQKEVEAQIKLVEKKLGAVEIEQMLSGEHDGNNAILTITPGAGGTESQDWAQMLLRMYLRWAQIRGFKAEVLDFQAGEEAGIKDATISVTGSYAYGYLKAEAGVHRLVRISPFDANKKRHTSFVSVFVYPEVEEDVAIDINPADLRIDVFRASGPGGQGVNTTDSAVRITHIPSKIVVQCQNERSQHKNKASAMKILKARLYELKKREEEEKLSSIHAAKKDIAWGSQIRSYVMHPYKMVKDHRTKHETSNVDDVMDGDLDSFIQAYLLWKK